MLYVTDPGGDRDSALDYFKLLDISVWMPEWAAVLELTSNE